MAGGRHRLLALVTVVGVWTGGAVAALALQSQGVQDTATTRRVREWLAIVEAHQPGRIDEALINVYYWPDDRLRALENDLVRVLRTRNPPIEASQLQLDVPDIRARILRRAAMLHTDAATLTSVRDSRTENWAATPRRGTGGVLLNDGFGTGFATSPAHWLLARLLLDALPTPASDEFVDLWYRATTAFQLASGDYATADDQLAHAQTLLPARAHVWLGTGVVHAHFATPSVQDALVDLKLPQGFVLKVFDERREMELAEQAFRRATALEPDNAEARLRLGRVLSLQQRHADALTELRAARRVAREPVQLYYVHLFTGQVESDLQQNELARLSFTQAAALFPQAQAPNFALSELASRQGDRAAALAALRRGPPKATGDAERPGAGPADRQMDADPWWTYDVSYARNAPDLVARLRNWFAAENR
jgi:tetratricopeptide (TPR) repeat protein